jgi:hypothetical protein
MIVSEREKEREKERERERGIPSLAKASPGILFFVCTLKHRYRRKKKTAGSWCIFLLQTLVLLVLDTQ